MTRLGRVSAVLLGALSLAGHASAYCRGRTCDPSDPAQACEKDKNGCVLSGKPLFWPSSCVSFDVQADGSPKSGLDADEVTGIAKSAAAAWTKADCSGVPPSIKAGSRGPVPCAESRFNETGLNANIIIFHDDEWPYEAADDAFGFTLVRFSTSTGEIYDADIEINSADFDITTDGAEGGADLRSILTHEFGHFFGLSHTSPDQDDATMRTDWDGVGTELRSLTDDDEKAICAAYPPNRIAPASCEPHNGFSGDCFVPVDTPHLRPGSACGIAQGSSAGACMALSGAVALFVFRRWRRARLVEPRS